MSSISSVGGLLLGVLGLSAVAYGFNSEVPYAIYSFSVGIVGTATGGVIVWLSGRKPGIVTIPRNENLLPAKTTAPELIRYKELYDESPIMQRTVSSDGTIIGCNQSYVKNFGNVKEDIIGKSLFDHTADQSIEKMHGIFEKWKKDGRVENEEVWLKRNNGSTFPCLISANNIYDEKGKLVGSNTLIRDISSVYEAHKVIEEHEMQKTQLEELEKANAMKEEFYMTFSKECQVPLEPIKKYAEMLKNSGGKKIGQSQLEAVNEIYDNAVKMEQLIQDTIDVQKLNGRRMEFKKEVFEVEGFMHEIKESCSPMMEDKKIEFVVNVSTKCSIKSDKARLRQVFYNLIQNAIDFVPQQGGRIEMGSNEDGKSILFYIKDNGIGISEKRKEKIFKKFYQVDLSFKRKYGGSGFGLVICKGIVENLGGKIWFESKEAEGATFYFSIPKAT